MVGELLRVIPDYLKRQAQERQTKRERLEEELLSRRPVLIVGGNPISLWDTEGVAKQPVVIGNKSDRNAKVVVPEMPGSFAVSYRYWDSDPSYIWYLVSLKGPEGSGLVINNQSGNSLRIDAAHPRLIHPYDYRFDDYHILRNLPEDTHERERRKLAFEHYAAPDGSILHHEIAVLAVLPQKGTIIYSGPGNTQHITLEIDRSSVKRIG